MNITAEQFLKFLQGSSLSKDEQDALIKTLPEMSIEQIQELGGILKADSEQVAGILSRLEENQKAELVKMKMAKKTGKQNP